MSASGEHKSAASENFQRQGRAALRVAGRKAGENRWARAFYRGGSSFCGSVGHVLHALWLEVTGFLFLVLAVIGAGATVPRISPLPGRHSDAQPRRARGHLYAVCLSISGLSRSGGRGGKANAARSYSARRKTPRCSQAWRLDSAGRKCSMRKSRSVVPKLCSANTSIWRGWVDSADESGSDSSSGNSHR